MNYFILRYWSATSFLIIQSNVKGTFRFQIQGRSALSFWPITSEGHSLFPEYRNGWWMFSTHSQTIANASYTLVFQLKFKTAIFWAKPSGLAIDTRPQKDTELSSTIESHAFFKVSPRGYPSSVCPDWVKQVNFPLPLKSFLPLSFCFLNIFKCQYKNIAILFLWSWIISSCLLQTFHCPTEEQKNNLFSIDLVIYNIIVPKKETCLESIWEGGVKESL